ncbi:MAG: hypothetical protein KBD52_01035 [Candidatus Pacebacteria bacterium]|nr:hypothetical protein [Candidatus Paceibacterota bacterium]
MVYYAWIMVKSVEQMVSSIEGSVRIMNDYPREEVDTEHFNKKLDTLIEWLKQTNENFKKLEELFHQVPDRTVFRETLKKRVDNLRPRLESLNEATLGIAQ